MNLYRNIYFVHRKMYNDLKEAGVTTEEIYDIITGGKVPNNISELTADIIRCYNSKMSFILGLTPSYYETNYLKDYYDSTTLGKDMQDLVKSQVAELIGSISDDCTEEAVTDSDITTNIQEDEKLYEVIIHNLDKGKENCEVVIQVLGSEFLPVVIGSKDKLIEYHLSNLRHSYNSGLLQEGSVVQYLGLKASEDAYKLTVAKAS